jgi:hypothetical protein
MENMRFMTNMDDQYMNKPDNEEDSKDDVEDIHPSDKLVNYFNNGKKILTMMMTMMMKKMIMITKGIWVMIARSSLALDWD